MRLLFGWVPVDDRAWEVQTPQDAEAFAAAALDEDEMAAGFVEQVAEVEVAALRHARVVAVALPRPAAPARLARSPFAAGEDQGRPVQGEDRPRAYGTEYATLKMRTHRSRGESSTGRV
ncbi:hypothetical protein OG592_38080 [Streptomyces avidinii]|uniref:hypothetical protein n=1 Tax=Streptomyces avidinii TaxID=1895 RepID=UPI00386DA48A|nr:hypothetical protein OG592_38080 [Streptomyces avidinii]